MIIEARKLNNESMMLYLKATRYDPEGSKPQEENKNITMKKNPNDKK